MECIQYTIRGVPAYLDADLRGYARQEAKSLNTTLVEILEKGLSLFKQHPKNQELLSLANTWVADPDADEAFDHMRSVDEDVWR